MKIAPDFARLLQAYFLDRLMRQQQASPHTIASYRDTFRLLIAFVQKRLKVAPSHLAVRDLDLILITAFLDHLEKDRGNSARSRNIRLAAIHSFFRYVALSEPAYGGLAQQILMLPRKRCERKPVDFLTEPEISALLAAPDRGTWGGSERLCTYSGSCADRIASIGTCGAFLELSDPGQRTLHQV